MNKMVTWVAVGCAMSIALTGCAPSSRGQEKPNSTVNWRSTGSDERPSAHDEALDAYVAAERATIPQIMEMNPGTYAEVTIEGIHPGGVEFTYIYAEQIDLAESADYFDTMVPTFQIMCDTQVFPAMKSAGVDSPQKVTYAYYNPDGTQIWSHTFQSA